MGKELKMREWRCTYRNKHAGTVESILDREADICKGSEEVHPWAQVHSHRGMPRKAEKSAFQSFSPPGPQRSGNIYACAPARERDNIHTLLRIHRIQISEKAWNSRVNLFTPLNYSGLLCPSNIVVHISAMSQWGTNQSLQDWVSNGSA